VKNEICRKPTFITTADVATLVQYDPYSKEFNELNKFLDKLYELISDTSVLISKTISGTARRKNNYLQRTFLTDPLTCFIR
jgi:hypothetical protein